MGHVAEGATRRPAALPMLGSAEWNSDPRGGGTHEAQHHCHQAHADLDHIREVRLQMAIWAPLGRAPPRFVNRRAALAAGATRPPAPTLGPLGPVTAPSPAPI